MRAREWQDLCSQLSDAAESLGLKANEKPADYISIHMALASGYLDHLGKLSVDGADYQGARNSRFVISKVSCLRKKHPKWVLAAELVETTRLFARNVADIQVEWIEKVAGHVLKDSYSEPHWSKKSGAVMAYLRRTLYGLPIVEKKAGKLLKNRSEALPRALYQELARRGRLRLQVSVFPAEPGACQGNRVGGGQGKKARHHGG